MAYEPKIAGKKNGFWPRVDNWEGGVYAAKQGRWACVFVAVVSIAVSVYLIYANRGVAAGWAGYLFLQGLVFVPIAIGVHKHSRIAVVLGLLLYCVGHALIASDTGELPGIVAIVVILMLINGVRGIFALHRIPEPPDVDPADRVRNTQLAE